MRSSTLAGDGRRGDLCGLAMSSGSPSEPGAGLPTPPWVGWSRLTSSDTHVIVLLSIWEFYYPFDLNTQVMPLPQRGGLRAHEADRHRRDQDRDTHEESSEPMKSMTCKQLGGPCDHQHQGQTADDVIKAQDRHLKEMVAGGDTAHAPALKEMKGRWKHPISGMGWYRAAKRNFAALRED
jgi:hypothetical protein